MYPHRIRLRGPWQCEPLARWIRHADGRIEVVESDLPPPRRMTMPSGWRAGGLGDFSGRVRFRRRFGYPGRIDNYERVWLTFAAIDGAAEIRLNDEPLVVRSTGNKQCLEFDITRLLQQSNHLEVIIDAFEDGGLTGEVALEIRCTAWLRNVHARRLDPDRRWQVTGEVVGTCPRPLELYIVTEQGTIAYSTIDAKEDGQPFTLVTDEAPDEPPSLRVELINGSTVWYAVDVTAVKEHQPDA